MPYKDPYKRRQAIIESKRRSRRAAGVPERALLTPDERKRRLKESHARWEAANPSKVRKIKAAAGIRRRDRLRREVVAMYGGACACCGESEFAFLAIDHADGGGSKHIRSFKQYYQYLKWLAAEAREGFRILCHNCNMARARYGTCPHGNGI